MSIGRRLIDMARSELNSLLDVAARHGRDDDEGGDGAPVEWQRRAHQEVEDAIHGRRTADPPPRPDGARPPRSGTGGSGAAGRGRASSATSEAARVRQAYAALEVTPGSDFETVRKSYRTLMRKYHPDHHTQTPEKQRAANEVAQKLTDAYKLLEQRLRK